MLTQPTQIVICLSTWSSAWILFFGPLPQLPGPSPALGLASTAPHSSSCSLTLKGLKGGISIRGAYSSPPVELALCPLPAPPHVRTPPRSTLSQPLLHLYETPNFGLPGIFELCCDLPDTL